MKKIFVLLFLISIALAATYTPQVTFEDPDGSSTANVVFRTGLSFTTNLSCNVLGGKVLSGTPCSGLANSTATVCVGTTMNVIPRFQSKWGTGTFHLASPYPLEASDGSYVCPDSQGRYCPQMEAFSGSHTTDDISWLSPAVYSGYQPPTGHAAGLSFDGSYGISLYNELGKFSTIQPVDYKRETEKPPYTNQKGYADVFCNGVYTFEVNGVQQDQQDMPVSGLVYPRYFVSTGTQKLKTSVSNIKCFAGIVTYPKDTGHPLWFNLFLFGYNTPNFQTAQQEDTINVVNIQPGLTVDSTALLARNGNNYLLRIHVTNNGDVRDRVTSPPIPVSKPLVGGFGATVTGTSSAACKSLFPSVSSGNCPDTPDNGFDSYFAQNISKNLYVIYSSKLSANKLQQYLCL